jgi:transcriptional regulator with XRE-family HTH domain
MTVPALMAKDGAGTGRPAAEPNDSAEIGGTVRAQREQRQMTIASLARKVGVSAAAISQIESGAVQPSLATLRKLAASLEIPVFRLFLPVEAEAVSVVRHADRVTIGRPSSGARYQLLSPSVQGQLEVMEVSIGPGQVSAPERLSHAGEECLVMLAGRGALEFGDAVVDLRAGDAATFQGTIPHRLRNPGRGELRALSIITPPSF